MTHLPDDAGLIQNLGSNERLDSVGGRRNHTVRVGPPDRRKKSDPDVQILRHNGAVEAIIVRCGCGEEIRINCVYQSHDSNLETT